mgnify:FL=1
MEKGLGRGLGALFGDDYTDLPQGESGARTVLPLHRVEPNPNQPRKDFDPEELQALADSLAQHGMLSPVAVRETGNGYYQIIAGERRWRAARLAGFTEIPVTVFQADDQEAAELALVENLQRQDLNPVEEAQGYRALMDEFDLTQEQVSGRVGKSRSAVANALRLLALPEPVLALLEVGQLSAGHARAILSVPGDKARQDFAIRIIEQSMSVREAEAMAGQLAREAKERAEQPDAAPLPEPAPDKNAPYWADCCRQLSEALSRGVQIKHGKRKGTIQLEYYDLEDFQTLYEALRALGKEASHGTK